MPQRRDDQRDVARALYHACERQIHDSFVSRPDDRPLLDFAAYETQSAGNEDADVEALLF